MYIYGSRSKSRLASVDDRLVAVCQRALDWQVMDITVICGHRGQAEQDEWYRTGRSKLRYPNSKHNAAPSMAVDLAPWPIDWRDSLAFARLAGLMGAAAAAEQVAIRWGGDWDRDGSSRDQTFMDLGHFELVI